MACGCLQRFLFQHHLLTDSDADDEEDYDDRKLMPPPSWAPRTSTSATASGQDGAADQKEDSSTPLRKMLPPQYSNVDVTELFPAFKKNQVSNWKEGKVTGQKL